MRAKHDYKIQGDTTIIFVKQKDIERQFTIDTEDFSKVIKYRWYITKDNYVKNAVLGFLHRYLMECPDDKVVDHISHNTLNNKRSNLRVISQSENMQNRLGAARNHSLGIRGVTFCKKTSMFRACTQINGQKHYIGEFITLREATQAISEKRRDLTQFSEMDLNYSKEFQNSLKAKELKDRSRKIELPKIAITCCNKRYSTTDYETYLNFDCYLHYPTSPEVEAGKVKFELTYHLKCVKHDCHKCVIVRYSKNNKIIDVEQGKKNKFVINHLAKIQPLVIKKIELPIPPLNTIIKSANSNWFYGVYIDDGLFERRSLDGQCKDEKYVITQKLVETIDQNLKAS